MEIKSLFYATIVIHAHELHHSSFLKMEIVRFFLYWIYWLLFGIMWALIKCITLFIFYRYQCRLYLIFVSSTFYVSFDVKREMALLLIISTFVRFACWKWRFYIQKKHVYFLGLRHKTKHNNIYYPFNHFQKTRSMNQL